MTRIFDCGCSECVSRQLRTDDPTAWVNLDPTGHYVDAEPYKELLRLCELLISVNGPDDEDLILEIVAMVAIIHATEAGDG